MNQDYMRKLAEILSRQEADALLVAPGEELEFLTGHSPHLCERFQGLFVKKDGAAFYICNLLSVDEMREALGEAVPVYGWFDGEDFAAVTAKALLEQGLAGKTVAVNTTVRAFNILQISPQAQVRFINGKPILEELRLYKTDDEMEKLRRSASLADKVFERLCGLIRPGITEKAVAERIGAWFLEMGAYAWDPIVASGPHSAQPHYTTGDRVLEERDIVIVDYGAVLDGMYSDMTRTFFLGEPSEKEREVYETVRRANEAGENAAVEGAFIPDVDQAARSVVEKAGYGNYFTTRLGHGIGYSVHEAPDIKATNRRALEKRMAFSIEPGIYLAGEFGVRIEDIVLIGPNGTEILNRAPKDPVVIRA